MFYEVTMTAEDFRRIALSFDGAEESSHMGVPDFRVGGRIFATLASQDDGFGNLKLTPELQQLLIAESPDVFLPIKGGWGRMGMTHIRLDEARERQMTDALHTAWRLRVDMNEKGSSRSKKPAKKRATRKPKRG
jgi:hypothetical protein